MASTLVPQGMVVPTLAGIFQRTCHLGPCRSSGESVCETIIQTRVYTSQGSFAFCLIYFIYLLTLCVCVHACAVRGQPVGAGSSYPYYIPQGSNLSGHARQQAPLPAEPS